ncbi:MAG: hypothetical protein ACRD1K_14335 [Acidimicrobiales bacterium]
MGVLTNAVRDLSGRIRGVLIILIILIIRGGKHFWAGPAACWRSSSSVR